ncbi:hypothetical protein CRUP_016091, partial [Coryphaenoides rupestris]
WAGLVDSSPHLLLRPSPRERDAGSVMNFNIAVIHAGATVQSEAAVAGPGGKVPYPGFGRVHSSLGESVLCGLLAARPLQGLVYEEERPPPTAWGPLAPMLEFVSAQTGLPIVAVGGGAGLGRMPQVVCQFFDPSESFRSEKKMKAGPPEEWRWKWREKRRRGAEEEEEGGGEEEGGREEGEEEEEEGGGEEEEGREEEGREGGGGRRRREEGGGGKEEERRRREGGGRRREEGGRKGGRRRGREGGGREEEEERGEN